MLKVLELFSGIGACSKALDNLGIEHEIVDAVEIDKFAIKSFNAIHGTDFESQDITTWDKDIECDLIMHGSPCQDFSRAGKQAGGDKGSGTRSSLMYETLRIVGKLKPTCVIWENVKNLLSEKHRHNFDAYILAMDGLGYKNFYSVVNAKDCGVPQNRERVITISVLKDSDITVYPLSFIKLRKTLKSVLEKKVPEKYYLTDKQLANIDVDEILEKDSSMEKKSKPIRVGGLYDKPGDKFSRHQAGSIYSTKGIAGTLDTMCGGNREPIIVDKGRIRKLTPKECWRLMGFDDDSFKKAQKINSNSQLYKQAGNSIVVPVLETILRSIYAQGRDTVQ